LRSLGFLQLMLEEWKWSEECSAAYVSDKQKSEKSKQ
jgi:hypothetical protein